MDLLRRTPRLLTDALSSVDVTRACRRAVLALALGVAISSAAPCDAADALQERALAERSGPRRGTMFSELAPAETGVITENRFADPTMWWERFQEFTIGALGTGVAIGDFDDDGRPDLFVVSKTETSRLFRNLGGWRFEDVTEKAGLAATGASGSSGWKWVKGLLGDDLGSWSNGATFADINNDGRLDLYVCRFGGPNLLYVNQRDGTFREEAAARGLAVTDASCMAAIADFDRDGWLDVYVLTNLLSHAEHPQGQRDYLFRNQRDGTFVDVTTQAGISGDAQGHSATWWDFDVDGWLDVYVANDFALPDRLYRNNGDGTFTEVLDRVVPHTPFSAMGADLGDINNDGLIDLLVADMAATTTEQDLRGMAESRTRTHDDATDAAPQYARNALFLNTGTGVCLEAAFLAGLAATDWTWSVRLEDLDNDGRLDLHATNGMVRELNNVDLVAKTMASANGRERVKLMRDSPVLAQANLAFRNTGDLQFENVSAAWGLDQHGVSLGAGFADFDGDGDLDLAFTNYEAGATLLRNDSDTGHRVTIALRGTVSNRFGIGATVRLQSDAGIQIRQLVLARGYASSSEPLLHFGLGAAGRIQRLTVNWPSGRSQMFEDLAVDRQFIIVEPSETFVASPVTAESNRAQFAEVSGETDFVLQPRRERVTETATQRLLPVRLTRVGPPLAVGDINGDGIDDVCVGGTTREPLKILMGTADGKFVTRDRPALAHSEVLPDGPLLVFDANGDGANDLLASKTGTARPAGAAEYQPHLWLNDRAGGGLVPAAEDALPSLRISAGALASVDFDRDGDLDLFIGGRVLPGRYPLSPQSALLTNEGGRFVDATKTMAPGLQQVGMVTSALWSDVDDDGWLDLLVALEWGGIRFWRNLSGGSLVDQSDAAGFSSAGSGWWYSLAAADFNGDRRIDYVAGNVGLNTQYEASPDRPALLFSGDFGGNNTTNILEARWDRDRLVPWRTLQDVGSVIPVVRQRVATNDAYARATLGELVGEQRLAGARRFAATEFRSGVFLSAPGGTFRFAPLPRIAQIAPFQGLAAGDFDGDGHADIYAVQNSHAPAPVVGRFDGGVGQLLRGDGRGFFAAVPASETALIVPGDGEALAVIDLGRDGWPDFLITQYTGPTLAFRNRGVSGQHALRVILRGPPGNPTAGGARLTMELADGTTQTNEVHLGSGYLTQSSAGCSFGFAESNPPRRLHIRWPSSQVTVHQVPSSSAELLIRAP